MLKLSAEKRLRADAEVYAAHFIWTQVIPRCTRVADAPPSARFSLRDLRFLMLFGDAFFAARVKVAKILLAHYTDVAALIAEAFRLRAEDLALRLYEDRMRTSSMAFCYALSRDDVSRPASGMFPDAVFVTKMYRCACERGSVRAFERVALVNLVIDESPYDCRKHLADAFGWACDCDNLELVDHIAREFEPTLEELNRCLTRAIGTNAVRVVERLLPILAEKYPHAVTTRTTELLQACSNCMLPMAKVRFFSIVANDAKVLARYCRPLLPGIERVVCELVRNTRLDALETLAWLCDEFELGLPEIVETIKIASAYDSRDSSPASQWLFRAAYGLQDPGLAITRARGRVIVSFTNTTGRILMPGDVVRESDLPPGVKAEFGGTGILPGGGATQAAAASDSSSKNLAEWWSIPQALLQTEIQRSDSRDYSDPWRSLAPSIMWEVKCGDIGVPGSDSDGQTETPTTYRRTPGFALDEIPPRVEDVLQDPRRLNIPGAAAVEDVPAPRRQPRQPSPSRNNDRQSRRGRDRPANHKKSHR